MSLFKEAGKSAVCEFQPVRCLQRVHLECLQITLHYLKTVPEATWRVSQPLLWPTSSPNTPQWVMENNSCFLEIAHRKTKQNKKKSTKPKLCPTMCLQKNSDIDSKVCPPPLWHLLPKIAHKLAGQTVDNSTLLEKILEINFWLFKFHHIFCHITKPRHARELSLYLKSLFYPVVEMPFYKKYKTNVIFCWFFLFWGGRGVGIFIVCFRVFWVVFFKFSRDWTLFFLLFYFVSILCLITELSKSLRTALNQDDWGTRYLG